MIGVESLSYISLRKSVVRKFYKKESILKNYYYFFQEFTIKKNPILERPL